MKFLWVAALATSLASAPAFSQSPTLTTDWTAMSMSQADCLARAEWAMRNTGMVRIERVGNSVFADSADQRNQLTIRCVADRQMAYVVAAGNHSDPRITDSLTSTLLRAFRDWR